MVKTGENCITKFKKSEQEKICNKLKEIKEIENKDIEKIVNIIQQNIISDKTTQCLFLNYLLRVSHKLLKESDNSNFGYFISKNLVNIHKYKIIGGEFKYLNS